LLTGNAEKAHFELMALLPGLHFEIISCFHHETLRKLAATNYHFRSLISDRDLESALPATNHVILPSGDKLLTSIELASLVSNSVLSKSAPA
jgi:hypothetical protein